MVGSGLIMIVALILLALVLAAIVVAVVVWFWGRDRDG